MLHSFALFLVLAPASGVLSPEAAEYNAKAMRFYDAGQLAPAVDEFYAAYQSMPDARRDLAGREQLAGSMRSTLLDLHEQTGGPAPLCRLQSILQEHADALMAAFPNDPDKLETRSARARHEEATQQLAAFGPDACKPPPPPVTAVLPVPEPSEPPAPAAVKAAPPMPPRENPVPRRLQVAGGVMLPLGLVALGVVGAVAGDYRRDQNSADALQGELAVRPCTDDDRARMRELLGATRREEAVMIALGVTGGALITAGTALLIRGGLKRRQTRLGLDMRQHQVGLTIAGEFRACGSRSSSRCLH
ncbi:MAG: hypothetical protein H0T76_00750 [Nannocystis sp.]|nr:hypothetical protein [Nannocystis sp.]MBA3544989.1 hypothetical protein [Nannocystis sp.]